MENRIIASGRALVRWYAMPCVFGSSSASSGASSYR